MSPFRLENNASPASLKEEEEEAFTAGFAGKSEALSEENAFFWAKLAALRVVSLVAYLTKMLRA